MEALGEATNSGDTSLVSLLREGIRRSLQTFSSSPVWGFYVDCLLWRKRPNNFSCNFLVLWPLCLPYVSGGEDISVLSVAGRWIPLHGRLILVGEILNWTTQSRLVWDRFGETGQGHDVTGKGQAMQGDGIVSSPWTEGGRVRKWGWRKRRREDIGDVRLWGVASDDPLDSSLTLLTFRDDWVEGLVTEASKDLSFQVEGEIKQSNICECRSSA